MIRVSPDIEVLQQYVFAISVRIPWDGDVGAIASVKAWSYDTTSTTGYVQLLSLRNSCIRRLASLGITLEMIVMYSS